MNIYDFDGTLYSGDSTVDFLKYSFKKHPGLIRFLPAMGIAALKHYGFKSIDKTAMKQIFYSMFTGYDAVALLEEFWGLGIGTAMFEEMIAIAKDWNLMQLELEVIEGNERAMALYRKMGFETISYIPNAIRLADGTLLKEFRMLKIL